MNDAKRHEHGNRHEKLHRTGGLDAPASAPEVRHEDSIPPELRSRRRDGEPPADLPPEEHEKDRAQVEKELDVGIDDSFPASDPPSIVSPRAAPDHGEHEERPEE